jgi:hypothetical protein
MPRGRDDHRHPAGDVLQHHVLHRRPFVVGERELLGEIGEDAQAVGAGVDHEIDRPLLAGQVERARRIENRRCHGKHAAIDRLSHLSHLLLSDFAQPFGQAGAYLKAAQTRRGSFPSRA